jgi:hypothetical protein
MSIDTYPAPESTASGRKKYVALVADGEAWRDQIVANLARCDARGVFGPSADCGAIYRWGVGVAKPSESDSTTAALIQMAGDVSLAKLRRPRLDWNVATDVFAESLVELVPHRVGSAALAEGDQQAVGPTPFECLATVVWAAAIPALSAELTPATTQSLIQSLLQLRDTVRDQDQPWSSAQLMIGAELGLTLAWRCQDLPGLDGLKSAALRALSEWVKQDEDAISAALRQPTELRLVLASLLRCKSLVKRTTKRKWSKRADQIGETLATWAAALTAPGGASAFSTARRQQVRDDWAADGLFARARRFDTESLPAAIDAVRGNPPSGSRLTWQAVLPPSLHHDANAKIAVMFAEWDVRRGRTHLDYSDSDVHIEVYAGRRQMIAGGWQTMIQTDGVEQQPAGAWSEVCQYSDDDVHYLEIEQPWTDGLLLQRQFILIRDDRCLLLADSVIPANPADATPRRIHYTSRMQLPAKMKLVHEPETREMFFDDNGRRALLIPLAASEWNIGPTDAIAKQADDGCLVLSAAGANRLFAPLWFDLQKRRFKRKRTWRQLTVADQLRISARHEAVAYRIQVGSEQWALYRSLADKVCRSFLGKHLIADFFLSRFDPEDGEHEALVTVYDDDDE